MTRYYALIFLLGLQLSGCAYYFGNRWENRILTAEKGAEAPQERSMAQGPQIPGEEANPRHTLVDFFANKDLGEWGLHNKVDPPRVILAKLSRRQDIQEVNDWLMAKKPWGHAGSTWAGNKNGDYDFTMIGLAAVLMRFGPDTTLLYPQTAEHLARNLLLPPKNKPHTWTPRMLKGMKDTENHILMTNISAYFREVWLNMAYQEENEDKISEIEQFLQQYLNKMGRTGFFEFNADPYCGYTLTTLVILEEFAASDRLRQQTRLVLDQANWQLALGSLGLRRYPPFRRRRERASRPELDAHPHAAMMRAWMLKAEGLDVTTEAIPHARHQALIAHLGSYIPPFKVMAWIRETPREFAAAMGHGYHSSPEIYSGGPGWLLSAGGVERQKVDQLAARPTVLFLNDGATDLNQCFYLSSPNDPKTWNHTGVHERFAVTPGFLHVPDQYKPEVEAFGWEIYRPWKERNFRIAATTGPAFALLAVFPDWEGSGEALARALGNANPRDSLKSTFQFPEGKKYLYDLKARHDQWVITQINEYPANRKIDLWPRLELYYPK
ncbi:MAG: hypothetical protein H6581_12685 [Bacteroidia bacterium]|nr:hypothetical protein [Bacteroidia bacterium]